MTVSIPENDPVEGAAFEPDDPQRPVTFREMQSLVGSVQTRTVIEEMTRTRVRRDRLMGWVVLCVLIASISWVAFLQFQSENDLRRSLYETCLGSQTERLEEAKFYRSLGALAKDPTSEGYALLQARIKALETPRDCANRYLR